MDLLYKSHNAWVPHSTIYHCVTETFCYKKVHCGTSVMHCGICEMGLFHEQCSILLHIQVSFSTHHSIPVQNQNWYEIILIQYKHAIHNIYFVVVVVFSIITWYFPSFSSALLHDIFLLSLQHYYMIFSFFSSRLFTVLLVTASTSTMFPGPPPDQCGSST